MDFPITVIVPTTGESERRHYLQRSIDSIFSQAGVDVRVLVVVNGGQWDEPLLSELETNPRIELVRLPEKSLPVALRIGRRYVKTPYFSELDDDDLLLPGGLQALAIALLKNPSADVAVGNGYVRWEGTDDVPVITDFNALRADPLRALLDKLWLYPGGAIFRTQSVTEKEFSRIVTYYEWTSLAASLCLTHRFTFVPTSVFVHHRGHPSSMDLSREALFGRIGALQAIIALPLPSDIRRGFRGKLGGQFHHCSAACLKEGRILHALAYHLASLTYPRGWRYFCYSRRLIYAMLRCRFAAE